jgi:hypothetical protein
VSGERQGKFVRLNATAVIPHPAQANAAVLDFDLNALSAGIDAVLNELLDDGRGSFDYFTGGDLVNELFW